MGKYVVFRLENEHYALGIHEVRSIESMLPITRVPGAKPFVKGVINLRGVVIPVVDLRHVFGIMTNDALSDNRIIVITTTEDEIGLIVDSTENVIDIDDALIQPAPDSIGKLEFVKDIAQIEGHVIALIDTASVLGIQE